MNSDIANHAALTTARAFHYQALIGLEKCFKLEVGQSIFFETDGDVSLFDTDASKSIQVEVKDYQSPLTDHHENIWKSLKNWLDPKFNHSAYGALVLHTTQSFGTRSKLVNWNEQTAPEKFKILKEIYTSRKIKNSSKEKPSSTLVIQQEVIETEPQKLHNVLGKVTLFTESDDEDTLKKNISKWFTGIPGSNRKSYLEGLVGFVYEQGDKQKWKISHASWTAKCEELTALYAQKKFTFPPFIGLEATPHEVEENKEQLFVQKICEIEHESQIPEAVGNWIELQNSLILELDKHPLYKDWTMNYQEKIIRNFKRSFSSAQLEDGDDIKLSKKLYNATISEHPLVVDDVLAPIEYKNGLIHDAMDDESRDLKWRLDL